MLNEPSHSMTAYLASNILFLSVGWGLESLSFSFIVNFTDLFVVRPSLADNWWNRKLGLKINFLFIWKHFSMPKEGFKRSVHKTYTILCHFLVPLLLRYTYNVISVPKTWFLYQLVLFKHHDWDLFGFGWFKRMIVRSEKILCALIFILKSY